MGFVASVITLNISISYSSSFVSYFRWGLSCHEISLNIHVTSQFEVFSVNLHLREDLSRFLPLSQNYTVTEFYSLAAGFRGGILLFLVMY